MVVIFWRTVYNLMFEMALERSRLSNDTVLHHSERTCHLMSNAAIIALCVITVIDLIHTNFCEKTLYGYLPTIFGGPGRAVRVYVCVWTTALKQNERWPRYLASWFALTASRSCSRSPVLTVSGASWLWSSLTYLLTSWTKFTGVKTFPDVDARYKARPFGVRQRHHRLKSRPEFKMINK